MSDYAKLCYKELIDLKERVANLEKNRVNNNSLELLFTTEGEKPARSFIKTFDFVSNAEQTINFNISGKISSTSLRAQIVVYLDGIKIRSVYTQNGEFSFVAKSQVDKGDHVLEVNLLYYLDFSLDNLTVKFVGAVSYKSYETELQVLNFATKSVIVFRCDNLVTVYEYNGDTLLKKLEFNALSAGVSGLNNDFAIAYVDSEKSLRMKIFNQNYDILSEIYLDSDVFKVSGAKGVDEFKFYSIKGSRAFVYDIDENLNFAKTRLNFTVKKVESSPNVLNAVIFTDYSDNVRLIV